MNDQARVLDLAERVIDRCARQPDLDGFLLWGDDALKCWIQIVASIVGNHLGWAARAEIPYVTDFSAQGATTQSKRADGVVIFDDGLTVLLDITSIPTRNVVGASAGDVPLKLAALLSADWDATVGFPRDTDAPGDELWWDKRRTATRIWGLELAALHGPTPLLGAREVFARKIARTVATLEAGHRASPARSLELLRDSLRVPLFEDLRIGNSAQAAFYAWASPVAGNSSHL